MAEGARDRRRLLSDDELSWASTGECACAAGETGRKCDATILSSLPHRSAMGDDPRIPGTRADVGSAVVPEAGAPVPVAYGKHDGRQPRSKPETFDELDAVHRLTLAWAVARTSTRSCGTWITGLNLIVHQLPMDSGSTVHLPEDARIS